MDLIDGIFVVAVIVMSVVIHEVMHGVAAERLGDPTARLAGRLTLNPIPHIDPFGSIILPILLTLSHSPIFFAWAKPVPYNPYNLKPGHFSEAIVAFAGPASNLIIALITGLLIRLSLLPQAADVVFLIVVVNIMLFLFNLIPIPPLDGSKVIEAFLPHGLAYKYKELRMRMEYNPFLGMGIILIVILFFGSTFGSVVYSIARIIAGIAL